MKSKNNSFRLNASKHLVVEFCKEFYKFCLFFVSDETRQNRLKILRRHFPAFLWEKALKTLFADTEQVAKPFFGRKLPV